MEKELLKESLYKNRVQDILRNHKGFLSNNYPDAVKEGEDIEQLKKQYSKERSIIDRVISNERSAFLSGIALSGLVFASVRFGPRYLAVKLGGAEKAKAIKEADEAAKKAGTRWMQQGFSFLFEASFGAWAGYRGYTIISSQNTNSYEEIAKIPLCAGRSIVSEKICSDWVDLVHNDISKDFWKNLDVEDCRLKDKSRWVSVLAFANNCIKRKAFEDSFRKQHGMKPGDPVDVPGDGVPVDILQILGKQSG